MLLLSSVSDPCGNYPCENGGTCIAERHNYKCKCASGWSGLECQCKYNLHILRYLILSTFFMSTNQVSCFVSKMLWCYTTTLSVVTIRFIVIYAVVITFTYQCNHGSI